jgi:hypothetical protein
MSGAIEEVDNVAAQVLSVLGEHTAAHTVADA